jgi:hypothetical protein
MKDTRVFLGDKSVVNGRTFTLDYLQENINIGSEFTICEHSCTENKALCVLTMLVLYDLSRDM